MNVVLSATQKQELYKTSCRIWFTPLRRICVACTSEFHTHIKCDFKELEIYLPKDVANLIKNYLDYRTELANIELQNPNKPLFNNNERNLCHSCVANQTWKTPWRTDFWDKFDWYEKDTGKDYFLNYHEKNDYFRFRVTPTDLSNNLNPYRPYSIVATVPPPAICHNKDMDYYTITEIPSESSPFGYISYCYNITSTNGTVTIKQVP